MQPVRIKYDDLVNSPTSLADAIEQGLGSGADALGVILITAYPQLRERLLRFSNTLATLPEELRETLARPEAKYSFGWSHGKEIMNGRPDTAKGSFYANPLSEPSVSEELKTKYPEYYAGNVWPDIEGFEEAFKGLGRFVADVGISLARACDAVGFSSNVAPLIENSQANKARLLHYYPREGDAEQVDDACGTHIDHSLLTGLCSAMFLRPIPEAVHAPPAEVSAPEGAGLYIYPRGKKEAVKVSIPADCLAFQTGEAIELLSRGKLAATPHYVTGAGEGVSRETFAFFLQPDVNDVIGENGETFGQFTKRVLERHYK